MSEVRYFGLEPEEAYDKHLSRFWIKSNIVLIKYHKDELDRKDLSSFGEEFNSLETIAKENPDISKKQEVKKAREYFEGFIYDLTTPSDKETQEIFENNLKQLYKTLF